MIPHPATVGHIPRVVDDKGVLLGRGDRAVVPRVAGPNGVVRGRVAAGAVAIGFAVGVGDSELETVDLPAVELHLQRVVGRASEVRGS